MPQLKPTFALHAGGTTSLSSSSVGGPVRIVVRRDMAIAADALEVWLTNRAGIAPNDALTLDLGDGDSEERVFIGRVVEIRPMLDGCLIRGVGTMDALLRLFATTHYESKSAGAIARDLIGQAGLTAGTIDDGPTRPAWTIDRRISAHSHLRGLAARLGFALHADRQGQIAFHGLGAAAGLDPGAGLAGLGGAAAGAVAGLPALGSETYSFGKQLLTAAATNRVPPTGAVQVTGESPMSSDGDKTVAWLSARAGDVQGIAGDGKVTLVRLEPLARTKDLAQRVAACWRATALRKARGIAATVLGRPGLDLGDQVTIDGVTDDAVNGSGYVAGLRHRFSAGAGFVTDVAVFAEPAS
jgi:hypothetical protein